MAVDLLDDLGLEWFFAQLDRDQKGGSGTRIHHMEVDPEADRIGPTGGKSRT
jgi:hypothetical protein